MGKALLLDTPTQSQLRLPLFGNTLTQRNIWYTTGKQNILLQDRKVVADGINSRKVVTVESPAPGALGGRLFTAVMKSFVWVL